MSGAELTPRLHCRVQGRSDAVLEVQASQPVQMEREVDSDGMENLALCLVKTLMPQQTMMLVRYLQHWLRMMVLTELYEEGLRNGQKLQVVLPEDPLRMDYRYITGDSGHRFDEQVESLDLQDELDDIDDIEEE